MTLAWDGPADLVGRPQVAAPKRTNWESGLPSQHAIRTFQRFAFNGLVLPLIDDAEPPRWTRHAIDWICDGRGDVKVNGEPMVDGALVPRMFTVGWKLQHALPSLAPNVRRRDLVCRLARRHRLRAHMVKHTLTAQTPIGNRRQLPAIAVIGRGASDSSVTSAP